MALSSTDVEDIAIRVVGLELRNTEDIELKIKSLQDNIEFIQSTKADNNTILDHSNVVHHVLDELQKLQEKGKNETLLENILSRKADSDIVNGILKRLASRLSVLESSVLKGFKVVCDKIVVSLGDKTSKQDFEGFKAHVDLLLCDIVEAIKSKMPGARALLRGRKPSTTCLSCESPIYVSRDRSQTPRNSLSKFFEPEPLPEPSIFKPNNNLGCTTTLIGASRNARLMQCKRERDALRRGQMSPMDMVSIRRACETPINKINIDI